MLLLLQSPAGGMRGMHCQASLCGFGVEPRACLLGKCSILWAQPELAESLRPFVLSDCKDPVLPRIRCEESHTLTSLLVEKMDRSIRMQNSRPQGACAGRVTLDWNGVTYPGVCSLVLEP